MHLSKGTHSRSNSAQSVLDTIMTGWPQPRKKFLFSTAGAGTIKKSWQFKMESCSKEWEWLFPLLWDLKWLQELVHSSHLRPNACVCQAHNVLFLPGMASQIKDQAQNCELCNDFLARQQKELMMQDCRNTLVKGWTRFRYCWRWELFSDCWLITTVTVPSCRSAIRYHCRISYKSNQLPLCMSWYCWHGYWQWSTVFQYTFC